MPWVLISVAVIAVIAIAWVIFFSVGSVTGGGPDHACQTEALAFTTTMQAYSAQETDGPPATSRQCTPHSLPISCSSPTRGSSSTARPARPVTTRGTTTSRRARSCRTATQTDPRRFSDGSADGRSRCMDSVSEEPVGEQSRRSGSWITTGVAVAGLIVIAVVVAATVTSNGKGVGFGPVTGAQDRAAQS